MNGWLGGSPGKRWTEVFFLAYSPFWMIWALCVLVPFKMYEVRAAPDPSCSSDLHCPDSDARRLLRLLDTQDFSKLDYLMTGVSAALPCVVIPYFFQTPLDRKKPWHRRYWVKANLWIAAFSYVGNYFWTHYFFEVLGAKYTFETWRLNNVSPSS